jgi:hypothetical protein
MTFHSRLLSRRGQSSAWARDVPIGPQAAGDWNAGRSNRV